MNVRTPKLALIGVLVALYAVGLASCSARQEHPGQPSVAGVEITGIKISNWLTYGITDVQISVVDTGEFVSCGNIHAQSACSTTFPLREYRQDKVRIDWRERGTPHSTDDFALKLPADFDLQRPAWIEVEVFAAGQAGARLIQ